MHTSPHKKLIKSASYLSVSIALIIFFAKAYGWLITDSQSMLASLIDAMLDISSSFINLVAIRFAFMPPDNNHRFGHEKFQDLAIFSQSIFLLSSSVFAMFSSCRVLIARTQISNQEHGVSIMYFCLVLTAILVLYQTYVVRTTNSKIIAADKLHYFSDFLMNIAVIISINLSSDYWFVDAITGIAISLYIMFSAFQLFRQAVRNLADEEFDEEEKQKILSIISKYKMIKGVHELKTRYAASKPFIQFHLEMDGHMSLNEAHVISDQISADLSVAFPGGEITIHQDPDDINEEAKYREIL